MYTLFYISACAYMSCELSCISLIFSAFAMTVPQAPIQVLAVTGSASGASVVFHNETASTLLADGTNLANRLSAKFQTTSPRFQHQSK